MFGQAVARKALETAQVAIDRANASLSRQDAHEARCTERWNEARLTWDRVEKAISTLSTADAELGKASEKNARGGMSLALTVAGTIIVILTGALATVLWHILTSH